MLKTDIMKQLYYSISTVKQHYSIKLATLDNAVNVVKFSLKSKCKKNKCIQIGKNISKSTTELTIEVRIVKISNQIRSSLQH